jgi:hypothetical protein
MIGNMLKSELFCGGLINPDLIKMVPAVTREHFYACDYLSKVPPDTLSLEGFLGGWLYRTIGSTEVSPYCRLSAKSAHLTTDPIPKAFNERFRQFASALLPRRSIAAPGGTGILTRFASASPFGYTLAPD